MLVHIDHSRGNFHGEFGNIETWDYNTGMLLPVEIEPQVSRTGPTGRNDTCNGSGALLVEKHAFNPAVVGFIAFESGPVVIGMPPRGFPEAVTGDRNSSVDEPHNKAPGNTHRPGDRPFHPSGRRE